MNCFMRFMPLRDWSFQLLLLILRLHVVHAHYSELDATYALIFSQATIFITLYSRRRLV